MSDPLLPDENEVAYQQWLGGDDHPRVRAALKRALDREAVASGAVASGEEVAARMAQLDLSATPVNDPAFVAAQVAADLRIESWLASFAPEPAQALDLYEAQLKETVRPARVGLRHILITVNDTLPENRREKVVARMAALAADPAPFDEKAARHSECPSAMNGGDLGLVEPERLYPEIAQAVALLSPGDPPVTVETPLGFHLVEMRERIPATPLTREEGIAAATALLAKRQQRARFAALTAEVKRALANRREGA